MNGEVSEEIGDDCKEQASDSKHREEQASDPKRNEASDPKEQASEVTVALDYASFTMTSAAKTITWSKKANKPVTHDILKDRVDLHLSRLYKAIGHEPQFLLATAEGNIKSNWRTRIYPKYKEGRLELTDEQRLLFSYATVIKDYLKQKFGSRLILLPRLDYIEGDDYFIVLKKIFRRLVVVSSDKDMRQLVSDDVCVYNPSKNSFEEYEEPHVASGDLSDGIPPATNNDEYMMNLELISLDHVPLSIQRDIFTKCIKPLLPKVQSPYPEIPLGLCCIHNTLKKNGVYASRKPIFDVLRRNGGLEYLVTLIEKNIDDLFTILSAVKDMNLTVFRISSDLMPHMSNIMLAEFCNDTSLSEKSRYLQVQDTIFERVKTKLRHVGAHARNLGIRLTFHPGQYNVVATTDKKAFEATVRDLAYHTRVLDYMLAGRDSVIVIHGGGTYNDRTATKLRWVKQFYLLPSSVRRRLVIENCERHFSVEDCLFISSKCNIPVVFDIHHYWCWNKIYNETPKRKLSIVIEDVLKTWSRRFIKPKFHVSSQAINARIGAHSDMIVELPIWMVQMSRERGVDIMIEAKAKEKAVEDLINRYYKSLKKQR